jgi:hypothetical protein
MEMRKVDIRWVKGGLKVDQRCVNLPVTMQLSPSYEGVTKRL